MPEKSGTFLVRETSPTSAVFSSVDDGQVITLSSNPGVEEGDVVEGTVATEPPLDVAWTLVDVVDRRSVVVEEASESPSAQALDLAPDEPGELARERSDDGELHVIAVDPGDEERAAAEIAEDPGTLELAARIGATRVTIRTGDGVVSVRYA